MFDSVFLNIVVIGGIVLAHVGLYFIATGAYVNRRNRG